jgi:branched-chain amino acid transport system substrate-binding protein
VGGSTSGGGSGAGSPAAAGHGGGTSSGAPGGGGTGGAVGGAVLVANLSPVKLGHIGTYSGLLGAIFAGGQQMAQVWANWTNNHGGLHGHAVQVVTGDDGGDPSRNLALTRDMVENQHVVAFVGSIVPLSLNGSKAYLEQKQIPVVGGDLTDVGWYQSPMFFPQGAVIDGPLKGSAQQAVKQGGPKVALLYCGEASACFRARDLFQQGAVQAAGGQLVYTAQVSLAQPDFTGECIQLRSNQVNAVVATVDGNSLSRLAQACKQQNVHVKYVSFALALVSSLRGDANLDGLVGTTALFPWMLSNGPAADYARAVATHAPTLNTSGTTAAVWGSGELVVAAARNLPLGAVATKDLLDGLYALKGETLGGLTPPLTFRRGQPPAPYNCYYSISLARGAFDTPSGMQATC